MEELPLRILVIAFTLIVELREVNLEPCDISRSVTVGVHPGAIHGFTVQYHISMVPRHTKKSL